MLTFDWEDNLTTVDESYDELTDSLKILSNWQWYYNLVCNSLTIGAGASVTIGAGTNYNLSATGAWILHDDIKRAKAFCIYGNFLQDTEVKPYVSPVDNPDQNTPEYVCMTESEQSWAFKAKDGWSTVVNTSACGKIIPISANALKFYIKNNGASSQTLNIIIRLIF